MSSSFALFLLTFISGCAWMYPYNKVPADRGVVNEIEGRYYSPRLKKYIPYWVALPERDDEDETLPAVFFLHGRNGTRHHFRDLGGTSVLSRYLNTSGRRFAVVSLTGSYSENNVNYNTYWVNGLRKGSHPWATIVLREMIPWIEQHHNLGGSPDNRMIAGISMGSHGAYQLGLTSQGMFRCVAGHSLVIRSYASMNKEFPGLFGTRTDFARRDPWSLLHIMQWKRQTQVKKFWLDIGGKDDPTFIKWAGRMEAELRRLGYAPALGDYFDAGVTHPQGDHSFTYSTQRLPEYVQWWGNCFPRTSDSN